MVERSHQGESPFPLFEGVVTSQEDCLSGTHSHQTAHGKRGAPSTDPGERVPPGRHGGGGEALEDKVLSPMPD